MRRQPGWLKFALSSETYLRALRNAAARSGAALPENVMSAIASRPQARLVEGLGARARGGIAGAIKPTERQQYLQRRVSKLPETEEGVPGAPGKGHALQRFMFDAMFGNKAKIMTHPDYPIAPLAPPGDPSRVVKKKSLTPEQRAEQARLLKRHLEEEKARPEWLAAKIPSGYERTSVSSPLAYEQTQVAPNKTKTGGALPTALGLGIPVAAAGLLLANKPGVQATLRSALEGGSTKEKDLSEALPEQPKQQAKIIHDALLARGMDPSKVRMGIDAPPGSGKTTLAKAISAQTGMSNYSLDWEPGRWWKSTIGLGADVEKMPRIPKGGEILEHYMLNRAYNPEAFDAMIHIRRDPEVIRQQLLKRGRGAFTSEMMDLKKSLGVAALGFDTLDGDSIDLGNGVEMKIRPEKGWGDALEKRLEAAGIDHRGLSRHEKILSLHEGQKTHGVGWTPYVKSPFTEQEQGVLERLLPTGLAAARAAMRP